MNEAPPLAGRPIRGASRRRASRGGQRAVVGRRASRRSRPDRRARAGDRLTRPDAEIVACPGLLPEVRAVVARLEPGVTVREAPCGGRCGFLPPPGAAPPPGVLAPRIVCAAAMGVHEAPPFPQGGTLFHHLAPAALVDGLVAGGAYLVTGARVGAWRERLDREGLTGDTARALFQETCRKVVLLDAGLVACDEPLRAFADHVGLPAERVAVSLEHLSLVVALSLERARRRDADARFADLSALVDTVSCLHPGLEEREVISRFVDLADVLFAPRLVVYVPVAAGASGAPLWSGEGDPAPLLTALAAPLPQDGVAGRDGTLLARVGPREEEVGRLGVEGLAFPQHLTRYLGMVPALAQACYLSVTRARKVEDLARSESELRRHRDRLDELVSERTALLQAAVADLEAALERVQTLSGLLPICSGCKKIRDDQGYWTRIEEYICSRSEATFTHGLCPACLERLYPEDGA